MQPRAVGISLAVAVHGALAVGLALAPQADIEPAAQTEAQKEGCVGVVSPACMVPGQKRKKAKPPVQQAADELPVEERRCPEPARRLLRRAEEPPPEVAVDLLQAQLVAALGSENGTRQDIGSHASNTGGERAERSNALADAINGQSKLGALLNKDATGDARKKKLGNILGSQDGQEGGDGKVNQSGSAYVGEVRKSILGKFQAPANIPPWELAGLVVRVKINRMTAAGGILEYAIAKKSGNELFDDAVVSYMAGYKSGVRTLPEPPADVLERINASGLTIDFAVKH
jgi:hypothetical protein